MLKNIILLVCVVALIFVGRGFLKRHPEADRTVNSLTKKMRQNYKSSWKSTQKFYRKNINSKAINKTLGSVKAPFEKFRKKSNDNQSTLRRPSNIKIVHGELPPGTITTATQN